MVIGGSLTETGLSNLIILLNYSKRTRALDRVIRGRGFKVPIKGIVVFTYEDVRFKNRLKRVFSAESSIKYIHAFMNNKCLTDSQVKSLCAFIRGQSLKISGGI